MNCTLAGSQDKTIFEAMARAQLVVTIPDETARPIDLATKLRQILNLSVEEKEQLGLSDRQMVVEKHNLDQLIKHLI